MSGLRHSWGEHWLVAQATVTLGIAHVAVKTLPFRVLARVLGLVEGRAADMSDPGTMERAARIGWATRAAAARIPWNSTCLMQALAAAGLLRRHGIGGTLSLGVRKGESPDEAILAHAWLQYGDLVLTGEREREHFAELTSFALR